jgi:hypothetical protein
LLCFFSDFPISPDSLVSTKTLSTHNKPKNNHDVRGKRFNTHARMLPSPRFSVASAFVPHLCFLSLLCYVRYLCYVRILLAPFHCPFSLFALISLFTWLCYLCFFRISLFSLRPLSRCFLSLLCFLSDFTISPDPSVRTKTFSTHNKPQNNHDVRRKRFNAHVRRHWTWRSAPHTNPRIPFARQARKWRRVETALAPEKRGPTSWGGPAESFDTSGRDKISAHHALFLSVSKNQ